MTQPWFRFYRGALHNPKVQRLPDKLYRAWGNLLCCTNDEGEVLVDDDLAFLLRVPVKQVRAWLVELTERALFDDIGNGRFRAHDWNDHQRKSDVSTTRVKQFRQRKRNGGETVSGNAPETEAEEETEKKSDANASGAPAPAESIAEQIWKIGPAYLKSHGATEKSARSLLGKWRRDFRDGPVLSALIEAQQQGISDAPAWIEARLHGQRNGSNQREIQLAAARASAGYADSGRAAWSDPEGDDGADRGGTDMAARIAH